MPSSLRSQEASAAGSPTQATFRFLPARRETIDETSSSPPKQKRKGFRRKFFDLGSLRSTPQSEMTEEELHEMNHPEYGRNASRSESSFLHKGSEENPKGESEGWALLETRFKEFDFKLVKDWNEEIDTLLVFSGLFSAITTAFNIETYKTLSPDTQEISLLLLQQISLQIAGASGPINATQPIFNIQQSFQPSSTSIRINILWFASLVCSLMAASLGMLVKQWLREYIAGEHPSPREGTRVRQYRYRGLSQWRVFEIMAFLPTLLQIALILFFIGLMDFLRLLHHSVAPPIIVLIGIWLLAYLATTTLPTLYPHCPYKSPQARVFFNLTRILPWFKSGLWFAHEFPYLSWSEHEREAHVDYHLELNALVRADATFASDDFLDSTIRTCLQDLESYQAVTCITRIFGHRLQKRAKLTYLTSQSVQLKEMTPKGFRTSTIILLDALSREIVRQKEATGTVTLVRWMREAIKCVGDGLANLPPTEPLNHPILEKTLSNLLRVFLSHGSAITIGFALRTLASRPSLYESQDPPPLELVPMITAHARTLVEGAITAHHQIDPISLSSAILSITCRMQTQLQADSFSRQNIRDTLFFLTAKMHPTNHQVYQTIHAPLWQKYASILDEKLPELSLVVREVLTLRVTSLILLASNFPGRHQADTHTVSG